MATYAPTLTHTHSHTHTHSYIQDHKGRGVLGEALLAPCSLRSLIALRGSGCAPDDAQLVVTVVVTIRETRAADPLTPFPVCG